MCLPHVTLFQLWAQPSMTGVHILAYPSDYESGCNSPFHFQSCMTAYQFNRFLILLLAAFVMLAFIRGTIGGKASSHSIECVLWKLSHTLGIECMLQKFSVFGECGFYNCQNWQKKISSKFTPTTSKIFAFSCQAIQKNKH